LNKEESKIVGVNSLQSLYEIVKENNKYENDMNNVLKIIKQENIASINARIRKLGLSKGLM
jgi:RPA family protein